MYVSAIARWGIKVLLLMLLMRPPAWAGEGIVSLDLCSDWLLLSYAGPGQVRAYSPLLYQYPAPWVQAGLPTHDGSLEQVLALKPARVVAGEYNALLLRARLEQLGIGVTVLPNPRRLRDIEDHIARARHILGQTSIMTPGVSPGNPARTRRESKLLLLGANGVAIGRNTLEHDIITAAGWSNYLDEDGLVELQLERLIVDPPDLIVSTGQQHSSLATRFAAHPALRRRLAASQWIEQQSWRWTCPGSWTYQLIEELAAWRER